MSEAGGTGRLELELLRALSTCGAEAQTLAEAAAHCAASLRESPLDLPFAAVYLLDADEPRALLAIATSPGVGPVLPTSIPITAGNPWRFAAALERAEPLVVRVAETETAAILGLVEPHGTERLGVLVAGLNPSRAFDDSYSTWIRLVGVLVAGTLARARARERERSRGAALEESERRFAWFMNHLPGFAWIKDPDGRYLFVNEAAARAFGRFRGDILGRTDEEIFPPATAAEFRRNDARALAGGSAVETVETLEHEDGVHHSLVSKFAIPAPSGPSLIGGIAIDVTQRIRFEAALRESEARFRSLADNAPVLIWVNGLEGCDFVNREYLRFLGCGWEDVRGLGWQSFVHPDDKEAYLAAYLHALQARQPFDAQVRLRARRRPVPLAALDRRAARDSRTGRSSATSAARTTSRSSSARSSRCWRPTGTRTSSWRRSRTSCATRSRPCAPRSRRCGSPAPRTRRCWRRRTASCSGSCGRWFG